MDHCESDASYSLPKGWLEKELWKMQVEIARYALHLWKKAPAKVKQEALKLGPKNLGLF